MIAPPAQGTERSVSGQDFVDGPHTGLKLTPGLHGRNYLEARTGHDKDGLFELGALFHLAPPIFSNMKCPKHLCPVSWACLSACLKIETPSRPRK